MHSTFKTLYLNCKSTRNATMPSVNRMQLSNVGHTESSKFTVKDLLDLNNPATAYKSPLAVIAHIDVNAFFAQVEQIRLGLDIQDPVVCLQWSSLIAVSYAARDYGVNRMDSLESAKLKCPILKPIHTAVFKKGETFWKYHDDDPVFPKPQDYKVSLDPYRRESRKIMKIFKSNCDLVEKASVDESFMDLGRIVFKRVLELYPELQTFIEKHEKHVQLPSISDLRIDKDVIFGEVVLNGQESEENDLMVDDWDDLFIIIGSIVTHEIRLEIREELGYTTSCGVAKVKTIAKLASGFKKPDNQTIVRNKSVNNFLGNFDFTDFWSMGGKTGEFIKQRIGPPLEDPIGYIRNNYDLQELEDILDDKPLAQKLYSMIRGDFASQLSPRIVLKSMNSSKNLRGDSGKTLEDARDWIKVFAADLYQRIVEMDEENHGSVQGSNIVKTRPKTISVHLRSARDFNNPHSKQSSLPIVNKDQLEDTFFRYGVNLLKSLEASYGQIYPLVNLNMTISNFDTDDAATNSILNFTKKGTATDAFKNLIPKREPVNSPIIDNEAHDEQSVAPDSYEVLTDGSLKCIRCQQVVIDRVEHDDFHFAIQLTQDLNGRSSLSDELRRVNNSRKSNGETVPKTRKRAKGNKKTSTKKTKVDKSQSKLPF